MKNRIERLVVLVLLCAAPLSTAAPFLDTFDTDTSANYIGTRTYGSGAVGFNVSGGTLNVTTGSSTTYSVFHKTAKLEVGEAASVVSVASNPHELYLTVSTISRSPNTGTENGIRFHVVSPSNIRARVYRNGAETSTNYGVYPTGIDLALHIFRVTETIYSVGYHDGFNLVILDDSIEIPQTVGVAGLYVGVEVYGGTRSFDNLRVDAGPVSATMEKQPYLIYPGRPTEMQILWQLSGSRTCILEWGRDAGFADGQVITTEYGTDHQHSHKLTGLQPGFTYWYRVTVGADEFEGSFRVAPQDFARNVTFFVYGGTLTNADAHERVCEAIISQYTADSRSRTFLLHVGDWVNHGMDEADWSNQYFSKEHPGIGHLIASLPVMGCIGRHETLGAGPDLLFPKYWPYPWADENDGLYYSFDYGPVHVAVLDQYTHQTPYGFGSAQIEWLENDLAAADKDWKILIVNAGGWSAGRDPTNNWSTENKAQVQQLIQPLCQTYDVDVVLAGQYGYYARCLVDGVHHITTGAGGAPFHYPGESSQDAPYLVTGPIQQYEFCKIEVQGNRLFFEAMQADGGVIDSFVVQRGLPGDANQDGFVNLLDLSDCASAWYGFDWSADFDASNRVDEQDLRILAANYLARPQEQDAALIDITEFMADNQGILLDEDADASDWIEVFNGENCPVNLFNWYLTNDPEDLTKWRFPSVEVPANEFLVIFASGKDRRTVGGQLHTNFTLPVSNGYLALVKPDGQTIVRQYRDGTYPQQETNVSFGLWMED